MPRPFLVTEAVWEQANLGCRVIEIDVVTDCGLVVDDVRNASANAEYVVIRLPMGYTHALAAMEAMRATFREVQMMYARTIDEAAKQRVSPFLRKTTACRVESGAGIRNLAERIVTGMFTTDRIALDASFGPGVSARRYRNWLTQAYYEGSAEIYALHTPASCIGFLMVQFKEKVLRYLLGGLFPDAQRSGLGVHLVAQAIALGETYGVTQIEAAVSSNNVPIINLYQFFGFQLILPKTSYVFTINQ